MKVNEGENVASGRSVKVIAEFSLAPLGVGTSVSKYVAEAVKALKGVKNIRYETTPMSTIIEGDSLDDVLGAIKVAHEAMIRSGAKRVECTIRIDDRRDKPRRMEDKVEAIKKLM